MNRHVLEVISTTTTAGEILSSAKYDRGQNPCCGRFLIATEGGDLSFRCPTCSLPDDLACEAQRRNNQENPPVEGGLVQLYANW